MKNQHSFETSVLLDTINVIAVGLAEEKEEKEEKVEGTEAVAEDDGNTGEGDERI